MLSKTQSKYIRSLALQKFRKSHNSFIIEGEKIALEWLSSNWKINMIIALDEWMDSHQGLLNRHQQAIHLSVSQQELQQVSNLKEANKVLLVAELPPLPTQEKVKGWSIALEGIRDPGNMGTILRIADWFGIKQVICSEDCVDPFSPKVIQAAMGAQLRVKITETDLKSWLPLQDLAILAAVLKGNNVFELPKIDQGILLIGNESFGISDALLEAVKHQKITIPRIGEAESLNAGVATGILCAVLRN